MKQKIPAEASRLDDAARAGWLYYVAGNTQDEIARKLGVSRQSAQRLVSLAVSERLIKVRLVTNRLAPSPNSRLIPLLIMSPTYQT